MAALGVVFLEPLEDIFHPTLNHLIKELSGSMVEVMLFSSIQSATMLPQDLVVAPSGTFGQFLPPWKTGALVVHWGAGSGCSW